MPMLPDLDENGYLPPGVHLASLEELIERFGHGSDERVAEGQSLQWLVPMCRRCGIVRLVVNGSFVTGKVDPQDADCLLVAGPTFDASGDAARALLAGLPYLSLQIVEAGDEADFYVDDLFGTDRAGRPKGLVEVIL